LPDLKLSDTELGQAVQQDYQAAWSTREDVVIRKMDHYALYRAYRSDTSDANAGRSDKNAIGPFNWSRLTIPFAYYVVETMLSRLSTDTPTVTIVPRSVEAVPYAEAKQLRINQMLNDVGWDAIVLSAVKDMLIMGDGFAKVYWDPETQRPCVTHIRWLDFMFSTEAGTMHDAECLFHTTWHTRESLTELAKRKGSNGRPLYRNIDMLRDQSQDRTASDAWWTQERLYAGAGNPANTRLEMTQVPIVECWYRDGSVITVGGAGYNVVIRSQPAPYEDNRGNPIRPFVSFSNTPDPGSPYAIGDVEMIEDMQREASLITNQAIDQSTRNINRGVLYDPTRISASQIDALLGTPGGKAAIKGGSLQTALQELPPVELTRDYDSALQRIQQMVAMTAGVSDADNTPPPSPNPSQMETATGAWIRNQEGNRRVDFKLFLISRAVRDIGCRLDWLDRQFNKSSQMVVPVKRGYAPKTGQKGVRPHPDAGVAVVSGSMNSHKHEYDVTVDAGSLSAPMGGEQAQKALMLAHTLMDPSLNLAQLVNTQELATMLVDAAGFEPDRILSPQAPQSQPGDQQAQQSQPGDQQAPQGQPGGPGAGGPPQVPGMPAPPGGGSPAPGPSPGGTPPQQGPPIGEPVGPAPPGLAPGTQLTQEQLQQIMAASQGAGGAPPEQAPMMQTGQPDQGTPQLSPEDLQALMAAVGARGDGQQTA
jgi:hypothetical protein